MAKLTHLKSREPRIVLTALRTFFALSRRLLDPKVGLVAIRLLGLTNAFRIKLVRRWRAISRLRAWLRVSSHCITKAPSEVQRLPAKRLSLTFTASVSDGERAASKRNSTADETLLTFCPPGPEERTNCSLNSPVLNIYIFRYLQHNVHCALHRYKG